MKRTDIKAGTVYAIRDAYGAPTPIVFLEDKAAGLYSRVREPGKGIRKLAEDKHTKAGRGGSGWSSVSRGYAAVTAGGGYRRKGLGGGLGDDIAAIDVAAELRRFLAGGGPAGETLMFEIVTSLNAVVPWDDAMAEYEAGERRDRERRQAASALTARTQAAVTALAGHGIAAAPYGSGSLQMTVAEAEKLVARLHGEADR